MFNNRRRLTYHLNLAGAQQNSAVTDPLDGGKIVRDQHNSRSAFSQLFDAFEAPCLEGHVPDSKHLVKKHDVCIEMDRNREAQPYDHSRRIFLYRNIDKIIDSRKFDDVRDLASYLTIRHTEDRAAEKNVLAASKIRVKAGAQL